MHLINIILPRYVGNTIEKDRNVVLGCGKYLATTYCTYLRLKEWIPTQREDGKADERLTGVNRPDLTYLDTWVHK